jgi:hypothetical protein
VGAQDIGHAVDQVDDGVVGQEGSQVGHVGF